MVEALRVELARCKSDHEQKLEVVNLKNAKKVQDSKAWIEELINSARVTHEQQGLLVVVMNEGNGGNLVAKNCHQ